MHFKALAGLVTEWAFPTGFFFVCITDYFVVVCPKVSYKLALVAYLVIYSVTIQL